MNKKIKIDHRVAVLNDINDAEGFIVVSDLNIGMFGSHTMLVAILASALVKNQALSGVVADALTLVKDFKTKQNET